MVICSRCFFLSSTFDPRNGGNAIYEATAITAVMPDELHGLRTALGFHENDDGTQHAIVKEPKLYRFPRDPSLNKRSTWIKKQSAWIQIEDGVEWVNRPHKKLEAWTEKAVFYFWEEQQDEPGANACPVTP